MRGPKTLREIKAVVNAIKRRDAEAAWQASLAHVVAASKVALQALAMEDKAGGVDQAPSQLPR